MLVFSCPSNRSADFFIASGLTPATALRIAHLDSTAVSGFASKTSGSEMPEAVESGGFESGLFGHRGQIGEAPIPLDPLCDRFRCMGGGAVLIESAIAPDPHPHVGAVYTFRQV